MATQGWEESLVGKMFTMQTQRPKLDPQDPCYTVGIVGCICKPSAGEIETNGSLEVTSQPVQPTW